MSERRSPEPDHHEGEPSGPTGATAENPFAEAERSRLTFLPVLLAAILTTVLLVAAFTPRTIAEGGEGEASWRLRVAPGVLALSIRLETAEETITAPLSGRASLDQTVVWQPGPGAAADGAAAIDTIVVGPTPVEAHSIRLTTDERGVGEASVQRVLWRRVHVSVIDEPVAVTDLVSIGRDGQVLEVVAEVPAA